MKFICLLCLGLLLSCQFTPSPESTEASKSPSPQTSEQSFDRPTVSFTFDDGITRDMPHHPFKVWNGMILEALAKAELQATFFVTGQNKQDEKGQFLLQSWSDAGHQIANHTFTHPNFNRSSLNAEDFATELLRTDSVIRSYPTYTKYFRFPYLKEGKTRGKIDSIRQVLLVNGYQNGHVTIDASDWFVNNRLLQHVRKEGPDGPKVAAYQAFYLDHILERARFYEQLSYDLHGRHIPHTLLLHHNLTSALFLAPLIERFQAAGWAVTDASTALNDPVYDQVPTTVPAGESLIWSLAKATGQYEDRLRYPAEDGQYEEPKMTALGL